MINNPIVMDSGVYVWEKYNAVVTTYSEKQGTIDDGFEEKPSDLDSSAKYLQYSFDSTTGIFTLSITNPGGKYYATNSPQKIYHYSSYLITGGGTEQRKNLYVPYTAVPDGYQKGSTYYRTVTSEDEAAYPADGEQDGYWYVLVGKTGAEGGGDSPVLQVKSVTPSESSQNVTPDAGYDGLSKVTVGAIQTETKTVTSNGTVTPSAGKYLKQVTVNVPTSSSPNLQTKSVSPSESTQTVTPDAGYDGLSSVSVSAIQTETKTVTSNGTVTPSSGKYLKQVTVNVPTSGGGIDTSDATATADDIAEGKTAYVDGKKLEGTLADYQAGAGATFASNYTEVSDDSAINFLCRGLNQGAKILRDGSYAKVFVKKTEFGDASAADVAQGKTFTSSSGLKITGTHVCSGGIDTSDATATASDIAEGVTAYVNGEKITGTIQKASTVYNLGLPEVQAEKINDTRIRLGMTTLSGPIIVGRGVTVRVGIDSDKISNVLGDATPEDVASGKTFSAGGGFTMVGTATASTPSLQEKSVTPSATEQTVTPDSGYDGLSRVTVEAMPTAALSTPTISVDSAGKITAKVEQTASGYVEAGSKSATKQLTTKGAATITPGTSDQTIASGTYLTGAQTIKGDANLVAGNIKSGVSIFGVAGSFEGSGGSGGSGDNNCEAYHITSASAKLNFKTTGTVKVWGYGSKRSSYTTTVYAFVGDGYYAGSSYGTPSKTSASFSINADGTLNGLPSGLQAVDLLVTIGV